MKSQFSPLTLKTFQHRMLGWFGKHRRDLPWRASRDPYRIWVAEIMLQQTRIAAVLPYYDKFLRAFPTVESLARTPEQKVLRLWSGLGYYSRARNLHRAAREITTRHIAEFPRTLESALALPGIGRYTAAAVLSIAYDAPLAVLDGNVARVLARLAAIRGDLRAPGRWRRLQELADNLLAADAPGDWNQALMELGETICTPRNPRCGACPASRWCRARALKLTDRIPAPRRKRAAVKIQIAAAILRDPLGRTILVRDPGAHDDVLFSRMWQFPAIEVSDDPEAALAAHLHEALKIDAASLHFEALPTARHGVTFRNITLLPFLARVPRLPKLPRTRVLPTQQYQPHSRIERDAQNRRRSNKKLTKNAGSMNLICLSQLRLYNSPMKHLTFPIVIEADADGYFVSCPALQGCYSQGDTYEEAVHNIKDAIRLHIEDRLADGEEIPEPVSISLSTVEVAV